MFSKIAAFELRYQLKNPVFWVAAGMFFLLTFASVTVDNVHIGDSANQNLNGPFAILTTHLIWSIFFMFVSTAFVANVVVRDDDTGFGPIIRATRVSKAAYLYGRFTGAFIACMLAFLAVPVAIMVGSIMPWLDPEKVGPFHISHYLFAYGVMALPTIFLTSAGFFALATATRSMMATYVGVVAFLILYTVATALGSKPEYMVPMAYMEPFGFGAFQLAARYWTAADRNTLLPALAGPLLFNRVIWTAVGFAFLGLAYALFRFETKGAKAKKKADRLAPEAARPALTAGAATPTRFGKGAAFAQLLARTRLDMTQVFGSPAFFVLLALGLFNAAGGLWFNDGGYGVDIYPATRLAIDVLEGAFTFVPLIVAIYYAGELVWRERDRKTEEIIDATPTPDWAFVVPKVAAIALVFVAMLGTSTLVGLAVQYLKGFHPTDTWKYFAWYTAPLTVSLTLFAVLAVFVQALSPHKFVGWGLMVAIIIAQITAGNLGFEHMLYRYGGGPIGPIVAHSDMNGAGVAGIGAWWVRAYWSFIALALMVLAYGLWRRGTETRLWPRLRRLPRRLGGGAGLLMGLGLAGAVAAGGYIWLNTNVWNDYRTAREDERWSADYEKALLPYEKILQPKITEVALSIDLHPHEAFAVTRGIYVLQNKTDAPVKMLHVRFDRDLKVQSLSVEGARPARTYERFNYRIFSFDTPMAPGETRRLSFQTWKGQKGFRNNRNQTRIVENGTFLNSFEIAPGIGMDRSTLLRDRAKRRRLGLPAEVRPAKLEDDSARAFSLLRKDSDWVKTDITIATDSDQTPVAPGYRVAEQTAGGRKTARFVTEAPIQNFFSVQSARYAVKEEAYKGIDLAVYYHPEHAWNVGRMMAAMKLALDYDQANFSPYQFRQARILEFPAYQGSFAQSFANTVPYSEDIGFLFDGKNPDKIDMVTYVTAHEIGHQWWAHQVIGADMQGVTMLDETLAQYSAIMAMEHLYGPDQIRKFLKYELDSYLRSRGGEAVEELPLMRVEDQGYIHYRKGSVVMYRLKSVIGEEAVNRALRRLIAQYAFKGAPYPSSKDLVALFREEAGPDPARQQLITDLFEKITVYDLKAEKVVAHKRADGRYDVTLTLNARKAYADGRGKETDAPLNEVMPVGVFVKEPGKPGFKASDVLTMQDVAVHSGRQTLTLTVAGLPRFAGLDPYNTIIDRNTDDNTAAVGK